MKKGCGSTLLFAVLTVVFLGCGEFFRRSFGGKWEFWDLIWMVGCYALCFFSLICTFLFFSMWRKTKSKSISESSTTFSSQAAPTPMDHSATCHADHAFPMREWRLTTLKDYEDLKDYVVLDMETTGLSPVSDHLLEIGMIQYQGGREVARFHRMVHPGISIPQRITEITGIQDSDVERAPTVTEVAPEAAAFFDGSIVVGHNVKFDLEFLMRACSQYMKNQPIFYVDTMVLAKKAFPDMGSYKLSRLIDQLGISKSQEHRAMSDADNTAKLLQKCLDRLIFMASDKPKKGERKTWTIQDVAGKEASPLFGKLFCFTGDFGYDRDLLPYELLEVGALYRTTVSGKTNFLVTGDLTHFGTTSKMKKADELNYNGANIQVITYADYKKLLGNAKKQLKDLENAASQG